MKERRNSGYGFVALAAILWGTTGTAQAFAPSGAGPLSIGAIRMILGGVIMVMIPLVKQRFHVGNIPRKKFILLASVCIAAYQPLFFTGVQRSGVAIGTLIAIGSAPVFSGIIDKLTGNRLSFQWKVSTMISLLGCVLLVGVDSTIQLDVMGVCCSLLAGMVYALYVKAAQKVLVLGPNQLANGLMFLLSGMILLPFLLMSDLTWVWSIRGSIVVLHLGVFSAALAFTFFARGLQSVDAPTAVTLTLVEPLTATLLGLFVLREQITMIQGFGLIVLFFGLAVNTKLVFQFLFPKYEEAS
jgi:DME family drug/metabolite transporter